MNEASTHQHHQPEKHHHLHNTCSGGRGSSAQPSSSSTARSGQQSPISSAFDHHTMMSPRQSPQGTESPLSPSSHQLPNESQATAGSASPAAHSTAMASTPASRFHQQTSQASLHGPSTGISPPSSSNSALPGSSTSHQQPQRQAHLPTAAQRRRARELATVLLTLATCQGCRRPVQDPVTLPCGHPSCMQCIKDRVLPRSIPPEDQVQPLPCLSHLPPRLPLSPMTVPCSAHGCPRSAIGRGIGVWAGHLPRYGLIPTYTERLPLGAQDVGPGAPPVDGFVMGVADHPLRLTVIGPQTRSKAHLFAVPPQGVEPLNTSAPHQTATTLLPSLATSDMLRTDVTLSKAVAILMRYASSPLPRPPRQRRSLPASTSPSLASPRSRHTRPGRTAGASRDQSASVASSSTSRARAVARSRRSTLGRSTARGQGASSLVTRRSHRPATSHAGMGIFGQNESELESGTVGGVRATASDSEDNFAHESDLDTGHEAAHGSAYLRAVPSRGSALGGRDDDRNIWTLHAATDDEFSEEENSDRFWPDRVGGAYSRPLLSNSAARRRGKGQLKRRRERRSDGSVSSPNSPTNPSAKHGDGKAAKTQAVTEEAAAARHLDSDWSTEESTTSARLHRDNGREALVDAVRRRRAVQAHKAAGSPSDADTDLDVPASDAHLRAVEAKHSLALSSKVGPNGEPLIQSAATLHSELVEVLECQLCYLLLYDPLTTPCGHTFCKSCFARSLDHGDRCPLCRADMPNFSFFQDHRPNTALLKILTSDTATFSDEDALDSDATQDAKAPSTSTYAGLSIALSSDGGKVNAASGEPRTGFIVDDDPESAPHHYGFKRLYEQRKSAIEQEEREARLSTPIFVCTLAFPGMPTILHIFEPRYRLMVRRCLESGNPRFGMVLPSRNNGGTEEFGTMLEIKSVQMLADGRSMLETVGSYRFRLLEKGSLDGYTVGRVERVDDISLEEEAELERAVLLRRTELERKKAAEATVERPRACPMAPSSSAPAHAHADRPSGNGLPGTIVARPEMPRAESDALSIYRSSHSPVLEPRQHRPAPEAQPVQASGEVVASRSPTALMATADERGSGHEDEGEEGLLPFKPVPAEPSIEELVDICTSFIETLRSGSAPWLLSRLNHTYGPMPSADEVERLGYWMALVMPIDEHEKAKLLPIRSRRLRLCLVVHWIEQLRQSWWFNSGCTVS